ncbi:MAG: histidine phosphatase family protein [Rhodobacteraceae bacterium]|nr:MAG: histidine phosphatase family protein [Paracoccaceae bacterium]
MSDRLTRRAVLLGASLAPLAAKADPVLAALAEPRTHAALRHALAPGGGDPPGFRLDDPATQRRLSDAGRAQARAIGARLAGVRFDHVLTSRWDRCRETAALLGLGPPRDAPALDSFFGDRARGPAQTEETRALLLAMAPEETALLVTHQVNVTALTGVVPRSGEVVVFTIDHAGGVEVRGRIAVPA